MAPSLPASVLTSPAGVIFLIDKLCVTYRLPAASSTELAFIADRVTGFLPSPPLTAALPASGLMLPSGPMLFMVPLRVVAYSVPLLLTVR
jgi:hypothetical protein